MEKIKVIFSAGESRKHRGCCDYMQAYLYDELAEKYGIEELYAEVSYPTAYRLDSDGEKYDYYSISPLKDGEMYVDEDGDPLEDGEWYGVAEGYCRLVNSDGKIVDEDDISFETLKAEIIEQAKKHGIPENMLKFD